MPIPLIAEAFRRGPALYAKIAPVLQWIPWLLGVAALKYYFGGARNSAERLLHGKVVMVTGGTSGIGSAVVRGLALRGAQVILLTQQPPSDPFVADYVEDLRAETANELIYAEQVDLASLYSIRRFATKWIDNTPPRRLDMVLLCASTLTPRHTSPTSTRDGLEPCWGINYLGNFHLLSILSPALRAQPPDRDVRIVMATCSSYTRGLLRAIKDSKSPLPAGKELGTSKLAFMVFGRALQKQLDSFERPDKQPNNVQVVMVDPGLTRTPGMRRWLSMGSLWGLLGYLVFWPLLWLVLKSPQQGAQTVLTAAMDAEFSRSPGGRFLRECRETACLRQEVGDDRVAQELWTFTEKQIIALEREGAVRRAREQKEDINGEAKANGSVYDEGAEATATSSQHGRKKGSKRR